MCMCVCMCVLCFTCVFGDRWAHAVGVRAISTRRRVHARVHARVHMPPRAYAHAHARGPGVSQEHGQTAGFKTGARSWWLIRRCCVCVCARARARARVRVRACNGVLCNMPASHSCPACGCVPVCGRLAGTSVCSRAHVDGARSAAGGRGRAADVEIAPAARGIEALAIGGTGLDP